MNDNISKILRSKVISYVMILTIITQVAYPLVNNTAFYATQNIEPNLANQEEKDLKSTCTGCDFGDAPTSYGTGGAQAGFTIKSSAGIGSETAGDAESSPRYSKDAKGDDSDGRDDENGINGSGPNDLYISLDDPTHTFEVAVNLSGSASFGIWIDQDANGTYDADEGQIYTGTSGANLFKYTFDPDDFNRSGVDGENHTFLRLRAVNGSTLTTADAATDYPSSRGETEDYQLTIKNSTYYSSLNHLKMEPQMCSTSGREFFYEGIPYGGSPTGRVDLEIRGYSNLGTFTQRCTGSPYVGWYTSGYTGDVSFVSYIDEDGDAGTTFDDERAIPMNITFTMNDMDPSRENFNFPKTNFTLNENLWVETTVGSGVTVEETYDSYKVVNRGTDGSNQETTTAWITVQTSADSTTPTTFRQDNDSIVIESAISHGAQPLYPISPRGGFRVEDLDDGEESFDTIDTKTDLNHKLKYKVELINSALYDDSRVSQGGEADAIRFQDFTLYFGDTLLDTTTFGNFILKDPAGKEICSVNSTKKTDPCGSELLLTLDSAKSTLNLKPASGTSWFWNIDQDGYYIEYQINVGSSVGSGGSVSEPYYTITTKEAEVSDKVKTNELAIIRPTDLGDDFSADFNVSDDSTFKTTISTDGMTCPGSGTKSIEVDGCAQQGETLYNKITIKNDVNYGQRLRFYLGDIPLESLDVENEFEYLDDIINNIHIKLNGSELIPNVDYEIEYDYDLEKDVLKMNMDLMGGDVLEILFTTNTNLINEDGEAFQPGSNDGSGEFTSDWIQNNIHILTTDPVNLDGSGLDADNVLSSDKFYIEWGDDTISGFSIDVTAKDTGEEEDSHYLDTQSQSTETDPGLAEPGEYINYEVIINNSGIIIQNNFVLDLNTLSDENLNTDASGIKYQVDGGAEQNLTADKKINLGSLNGATTKIVNIKVPVNKTINYSKDPKEISGQEIGYSSSIISSTMTNVSNTINLMDESTTGYVNFSLNKTITDTKADKKLFKNLHLFDRTIKEDGLAQPTETLYYKIDVTNKGFSNLASLSISDDLKDTDLVASNINNIEINGTPASNNIVDNSSFEVNLIDGIENGQTVSITFEVKASDVFDDSKTINTTAKATYGSSVVVEDDSALGENADIVKDTTIDPINPIDPDPEEDGIIFTKNVKSNDSDSVASTNEVLTYTYTVQNNMITSEKANLPLQGIKIVEPFSNVSEGGDLDLLDGGTKPVVKVGKKTLVEGTDYTLEDDSITLIRPLSVGETLTITTDIKTASTFDTTPTIDTTAIMTASNYTDTAGASINIKEQHSTYGEDNTTADIVKSMKIDPIDPINPDPEEDGIIFKKAVTGGTGALEAAKPNDSLTYTYTIQNNMISPTKANLPLQGITVTDPFEKEDSDLSTGASLVDIKVGSDILIKDVDYTLSGNIITFIRPLKVGEEYKITVTTKAANIFDESSSIDTTAIMTATNYVDATDKIVDIKEQHSTYGVDGNEISDILKDVTIDPTNPTNGVGFEKTLTDKDESGAVQPSEEIAYEYVISNPSSKTKSNVVLTNVILTDDLTKEADLDTRDLNGTVTVVGGDRAGEYTVQDVVSGLDLGNIAPDETVTVTFNMNANSVFDISNEIDTDATLDADNFDVIEETDVDIIKDITIDPTDPTNGIGFEKTLTDANKDGLAQLGETLTYEYTITNPKGSAKSNVVLTNVILKDDLTKEVDLDTSDLTGTVTVSGGDKAGEYTIQDVVSGLNLGNIAPDKTVTVTFDINAANEFAATNGINSQAFIKTKNTEDLVIYETYNEETGSYEDVKPDIPQDFTVDSSDIDFKKEITGATGLDLDGNSVVKPGDLITYTYTIENNSKTPVKGLRLKDPLNDPDITYDPTALVSLNVGGVSVEADHTIQELIDGLVIGILKPGEKAIVKVEAQVNSEFTQTNGINSKAIVSMAQTSSTDKILEGTDPDTGEYIDVVPDIGQSFEISSSQDAVDFKKVVSGGTGDMGSAVPGDVLSYTYTIKNTGSIPFKGLKLIDGLTQEKDLDTSDLTGKVEVKGGQKDGGSYTIQNVIDGLVLGVLYPGEKVEVNFELPTDSTFSEINGINSKAIVRMSAANTKDVILEGTDPDTGEYIDLIDLAQDGTIDPTDPKNGVKFIKTVTDINGNKDGLAQPGEVLEYKYEITNLDPNKSVVPLINATLSDDLSSEVDLDYSKASEVTLSSPAGNTILTIDDLKTGIDLGILNSGDTATVSFTIPTNVKFVAIDGIETEAKLNLSETNGAQEAVETTIPDIAQDTTGADLSANITHEVCYITDLSSPKTSCDTTATNEVEEGQTIGYKIVIDNSEGNFDHEFTASRTPNEITLTGGGDTLGVYEVNSSNIVEIKDNDGNDLSIAGDKLLVEEGKVVTIIYEDQTGIFSEGQNIRNEIEIKDNLMSHFSNALEIEKNIPKKERLISDGMVLMLDIKAKQINKEINALGSENAKKQYVIDKLHVNNIDTEGNITPTTASDISIYNIWTSEEAVLDNLEGRDTETMGKTHFPEAGMYQLKFSNGTYSSTSTIMVQSTASKSLTPSFDNIDDKTYNVVTQAGDEYYIYKNNDSVVITKDKNSILKEQEEIKYENENVINKIENKIRDLNNKLNNL